MMIIPTECDMAKATPLITKRIMIPRAASNLLKTDAPSASDKEDSQT
jgi:hypothetical protein